MAFWYRYGNKFLPLSDLTVVETEIVTPAAGVVVNFKVNGMVVKTQTVDTSANAETLAKAWADQFQAKVEQGGGVVITIVDDF